MHGAGDSFIDDICRREDMISKEEDGASFTTWPVANISIDPSAGKPIHMSKLQTKHGAACLILKY